MSRIIEIIGDIGLKLATLLSKVIPGLDTYIEDFAGLIRWSFILLVAAAVAGGGWFGWQHLHAKKAAVEEAASTQVRVERAVKKTYTDTYTVMGTIRGATENELRFEIEGTLLHYNFAEGAKISKGAIIARMDTKDSLSKVAYAKGRYNSEKSTYYSAAQRSKVYEDLFKMNAISETKLQDARFEADSAQERMKAALSEFELAQSNLSKTNLTSPGDGILAEILIQAGEFVTPHDVVAKFVSQGDANFEVDIPEKDVSKIKIGSKAKITCDAYSGKEFWGTVREIAPTVKEKTRTTEVKVNVPNDDGKLRSGMFARGEVVLSETSDAILVPPDSIIALGTDTKLVPIVKPSATKQGQGIVELRQVTIAQTTAKAAVISSGIKPDELVVVETQGQLSDGLPVQFTENTPAEPTPAAAGTNTAAH